jgi:hypothetical protein
MPESAAHWTTLPPLARAAPVDASGEPLRPGTSSRALGQKLLQSITWRPARRVASRLVGEHVQGGLSPGMRSASSKAGPAPLPLATCPPLTHGPEIESRPGRKANITVKFWNMGYMGDFVFVPPPVSKDSSSWGPRPVGYAHL